MIKSEYEIFEREQERREFIGLGVIAGLAIICLVLIIKLITARHETVRAEALLYKDFIATMETTNPDALKSQETK